MDAALKRSGQVASTALAEDAEFENNLFTKASFFTSSRRDVRREELLDQLIDAGRGLAATYRGLLDDQEIWRHLARGEVNRQEVGLRGQVLLVEAARQNVEVVLDVLGYQGPPPAYEWVDRIQKPLISLLAHGVTPDHAAVLAADTECQLRQLVARLEDLTDEADRVARSHEAGGRRDVKSRLRRMVAAAHDRVTPTRLLLVAVVSDMVGTGLMEGVGEGATAGVSTLIAAGVCAALTHRSNPPGGDMVADLKSGLTTLYDVIKRAGEPPRQDYDGLLIRRAAMQLALDAARLPDPDATRRWQDWVEDVDELVTDASFTEGGALRLHDDASRLINMAS
ncbi:hypothetical protein [Phycicoccus avicenniae]|uniref:hypothetical protein n=1 Tax=Phycicoccus avicenniae TaxID=2828860 RepID=UPI003D28C04D